MVIGILDDVTDTIRAIVTLSIVVLIYIILRNLGIIGNGGSGNKNIGDDNPDTIDARRIKVKGFRDSVEDYRIETSATEGQVISEVFNESDRVQNGDIIGEIKGGKDEYRIYGGGIESITTPPQVVVYADGEKISGVKEIEPVNSNNNNGFLGNLL